MISRSVLATNDRFPFTGRKVDVGGEAKAVHRVDGHLAGGIEIFFIGSDAPEPDADAGQAAHQRQAAAVDRDERMASGRKLDVYKRQSITCLSALLRVINPSAYMLP